MEIASQALETLGLADYALRYLDELSGGELQKVIIARALAQEPEILLMDEPTSSLDLKNQLEVLTLIQQISRGRGIAAVVAMHDLNLALRFADRFILLKDKTIYAAGGPEVITPENIESVYAVPVTIAAHNGSRVVIPL
jgi:iron complex transport system ATP-binding protein